MTRATSAAFADFELEEDLPEDPTPTEPYAATCPQLRRQVHSAIRFVLCSLGGAVVFLAFLAWLAT